MELIPLFELTILYQSSVNLDSYDDSEEDDTLRKIRLKDDGGEYKTDTGYFDLMINPIVSLQPRYLCSKDGEVKKYFTEITFANGDLSYALGKPDSVYKKLQEYVKILPEIEIKNGEE